MEKYDIGIIGTGVAGAFAALKSAKNYKNAKIVIFDLGRPPGKRRRQLEGWLGCFPFSDGKIHLSDVNQLKKIIDGRKIAPAEKWVNNIYSTSGSLKIIKDKLPSSSIVKKCASEGFEIQLNDYIQWKPDYIHKLSKYISDEIKLSNNVSFSFDNEVYQILKKGNVFQVITQSGDYYCENIIISVGRSGWRWANSLYKSFGLEVDDSQLNVGIRVECASQYMKDFNKSHCTLLRDDLEIGPFNWNGTVIPEDHADLVISAFRSNEDRWKTDKVSFSVIGKFANDKGISETERLAKLAFLLFNDRVGKEKIKSIIKKNSPLSQLKEYDWLVDKLNELTSIFPFLLDRGYYHSPTIKPICGNVNLDSSLETDIDGLYVVGESAGFIGINAAAISGSIVVDSILR